MILHSLVIRKELALYHTLSFKMTKISRKRESEAQNTEVSTSSKRSKTEFDGKDENIRTDLSTNTVIVQVNTSVSGDRLLTSQPGQIGIQTIGDQTWYEKRLDEKYDVLLQFKEEGKLPTYIALKNYAAAQGQVVGSQAGSMSGKAVSGVVSGFVEAHAPMLACIPVIGDIMDMITGTFTTTLIKEVVTQSISCLINLSIGDSNPDPGKHYWNLENSETTSTLRLMQTSAFLALIESKRHFRFRLHYQYIGRLISNMYEAIYEDFFLKFATKFLQTEAGFNMAAFVETNGGPTQVLQRVKKEFNELMEIDFSTLVSKFKILFGSLTKYISDQFQKYLEMAKKEIKQTGKELQEQLKSITLEKLGDVGNSILEGQIFVQGKDYLMKRYNDFWKKFDKKRTKEIEKYKLRWKVELAIAIFSPGTTHLSAMMPERSQSKYIKRSIQILRKKDGGDPELKPVKDPEKHPEKDPKDDDEKDSEEDDEEDSEEDDENDPKEDDEVPDEIPDENGLFDGYRGVEIEEGKTVEMGCNFMRPITEFFFGRTNSSNLSPTRSMAIQSQRYQSKPSNSQVGKIFTRSPLLREVDDFLHVECAQVVEPFLNLVSAMSGIDIFHQLQSGVQFSDTEDPEIRGVNINIGKSSNGHDWSLCISLAKSFGVTFSILRDGESRFELPSVGYIFDLFGGLVGVDSLDDSIPGPINEIGEGLSLNGLAFVWPLGGTAQILCGVKFIFDEQSIFARNLGLKAIHQRLEMNFLQDGVFFNTSFVLSLGDIQIAGLVPVSDDEPFVLDLIAPRPVPLASLITSIPGIGEISDTGLSALASDDVNVETLSIGLGRSGVEFLNVVVASNMSPRLGTVQIEDPYASLSLQSPFTRDRSATLGYMFSLSFGSFGSPVRFYGELTYQNRKLSGIVSGTMLGSFGIGDIFDLDSSNMPPDLVLTDDMKISFDLTQLKLEEPSLSLVFGDDRILEFSTPSISVAIGGQEQLALTCSFPTSEATGGMLHSVGLDYAKKVDGQRGPRCIFSTTISMQDNLIEKGLTLLGPPGQVIIKQDQLTIGIEKGSGRKKTRMLFPDSLIPESITFGNDEQGLTITNAQGFVNPRKPLAFGAGGKMELNILGITTLSLGGELSYGPYGFSGLFEYQGDIRIGKHIVLASLGVVFAIKSAQPQAGARTTFLLYGEEGELELKMVPAPVPYPSR